MEITIRACRVNSGLSQAEMAAAVGVTKDTISHWELGQSEPTLSQLRAISEVSGIPLEHIVLNRPKALVCNS